MAKKSKQEALNVTRLINEILIGQLRIPLHQIVNDKTFSKYTFMQRPDLLISNIYYDTVNNNEEEYIKNLICYAEVKDTTCKYGDKEWIDAFNQAKIKSEKLQIPYFVITNCNVAYFYNAKNHKELMLNGNPIREFQNLDILNLIVSRLHRNPELFNVETDTGLKSAITETIFNKKLWELANIYRQIDFKNVTEKIDFTIGFIALKYFEEKETSDGTKKNSELYWSDIVSSERKRFISDLKGYIQRLESKTQFNEFKNLMNIVEDKIDNVDLEHIEEIFTTIESMKELHGCGFDLFGAVYEMFASNKEKSDFGEYFTRRHYTRVFSKLLLSDEVAFDKDRKFTILDPACGTGGFLTETYKVLYDNYLKSNTLTEDAKKFLKKECIYGIDVKQENVSRTKLNMFLVGDGHNHIAKENTLQVLKGKDVLKRLDWSKFDYIITNPPYGNGTIKSTSNSITTRRFELAFISKIIDMLKDKGKACTIIPDGFFENPSYGKFRKEVLEKVNISAIVSLPKFAFAPYTKEKTYALFMEKKNSKNTKIQQTPIWMYIIDNDGYANSDKRFQTKLKNADGSWMHDEITSWFSKIELVEKVGKLESYWMNFSDMNNPSEWIDEKGNPQKITKGGFVKIENIKEDNYFNLLPEYHLRKQESEFILIDDLKTKLNDVEKNIDEYFSQHKDDSFLNTIISEVKTLSEKTITIDTSHIKDEIPIKKILTYVSRNDSLSEEGIYNLPPSGDTITVLSGSTSDIKYGLINGHTPNIHILDGKQGLHLITRGKAGKLTYVPEGKYATNTNAFLLYLKDTEKALLGISNDEEEAIYLKYLLIYLQPVFYEISSNSDVSVFPLTEMIKSYEIPYFKYNDSMKDSVNTYEKFIKFVEKVDLLKFKL